MRVFLDTSVLVAAFATRGLCADVLRTVRAMRPRFRERVAKDAVAL